MAIERIVTIKTYQGTSNDEKPTGSDIPAGSTFHENDTGKKYIWLNSNWVEDISGPISDNTYNTYKEVQAVSRRLAEKQYLASDLNIEADAGHYNFIENR